MKKIVTSLQRILAVICILLTAFTLVSCEPKETMTITEFTQYRDLSRSPDKIKVHYEDDVIGDFEITERAVIDEIITILFDRTVFRRTAPRQATTEECGRCTEKKRLE